MFCDNISYKFLRPTQVWNGPLCRNKSDLSRPSLGVATYWKSNNMEACAKKFSEILANNIENGESDWLSKCI